MKISETQWHQMSNAISKCLYKKGYTASKVYHVVKEFWKIYWDMKEQQ